MAHLPIVRRLPLWPAPALLTWTGAWAAHLVATRLGLPTTVAGGLGVAVGLAAAFRMQSATRAFIVAVGFPLSLAASGTFTPPAWVWLALLASLAMLYPLKLWGDAPVFPTPSGALLGLERLVPLPPEARILDAGCGSGSALRELHAAYPSAGLYGVEWSWPLRVVAAIRCPYATVTRDDMWKLDWSSYSMVYVFQRPETMRRLMEKATSELPAGAVLVSLEFPVDGLAAWRTLRCSDGRQAWIYRHGLC